MTNKLVIKLKKEDILGNITHIPIVGVNEMYQTAGGKSKKRILTPKARKYKKFLISDLQELTKDFILPDAEKFFVYAKFFLHSPLTKAKELDKRYIRDVDNLFKPINDAFEGKDGFWENDKMIRGVAGIIKENVYDYTRIELYIFDLKEIEEKLDILFLKKG